MNENPWLIGGGIGLGIGIVAVPVLAVPVAVALGVGGGALSFSAVVAGIIATSGTIGAVVGLAKDDKKRTPDNGNEVVERIFKEESAKNLLSHILDYQTREIKNILATKKDEATALKGITSILSDYEIEKNDKEEYKIKTTRANLAKILESKYGKTDSHENATRVWNLSSSFKILYLGALNNDAIDANKIKALKMINQIQTDHQAGGFCETFEREIFAVSKNISDRRSYLGIVGEEIARNPPQQKNGNQSIMPFPQNLNYLFSESFKVAHKNKSPSTSPEVTGKTFQLGPNCARL